MKYLSRALYVCVLALSVVALWPSLQLLAANSRTALNSLAATDDDISAQQEALTAEVKALQQMAQVAYTQLQQKASQDEAPELYTQCQEMAEVIAYLSYRIQAIATMEDVNDCEAQAAACQYQMRELMSNIEAFEGSNIFTATTIEGVEMTFKVISQSESTCQVGTGEESAISKSTSGPVTIPSSANGYSVVAIGEQAFHDCNSITSLVIPNTITQIGYYGIISCI